LCRRSITRRVKGGDIFKLEYHMRNRPDDLIVAIVTSILLILIIYVALDSPLRSIIGLFFLLVLPGYVSISAFFPYKGSIDTVERIALSLGLSIAIFPLLGLVQYYAFSGIDFEVLEFVLTGFVIVVAFIAWQRRRRLPEDERFVIDLEIKLSMKGMDWIDRALVIGIVIAASASLIMLSITLSAPITRGGFSDIGLLGPTGQIGGYPVNLMVDENARLNVSVSSHEATEKNYCLVILLQPENVTGENITHWRSGNPFNGVQSLDEGLAMAYNFTLQPSEYLNRTFGFSSSQNGTFKLRFMLFYEGQDVHGQPSHEGWLWVNIRS